MDSSEEYIDDPMEVSSSSATQKKSTKNKKEPPKKTFQLKWLELTEFKGWLKAVPGNSHAAKCMCCGVVLSAGKSDLNKHAKTPKHQLNVKAIRNIVPANKALSGQCSERLQHERNVKEMEVKLSSFFAEHNVAFLPADHLVKILKTGITDSEIAKDLTLGHKKCSAIVRNIIAKTETEELAEILRKTCFSVLIDESTDIANKKNMYILARYVSPLKKVETRLLELVELDARDSSGEALWSKFIACLDKHQIPRENIIGLGTDHASVMTGWKDSFWSRLKTSCPWAILIGCICHSAASISKAACAELPSFVSNHLRSVSSYMSQSPKRCAELRDFQELWEIEAKKILKLSSTRWLVMQPCVERYLENKDSLLGFFRTKVREEPKDREAATILQDMQNPFTEAYLHFLNYVLTFMNEFNAMFQARDTLIHKLSSSSEKLLKKFSLNFMRPEKLGMDTSNPCNFLPLERVYLGPQCTKFVENLQVLSNDESKKKKSKAEIEKEWTDAVTAFRTKCLNFYVTAAAEMRKRLPLHKIFKEMAFLDPAVFLSSNVRVEDGGLTDLYELSGRFRARFDLDDTKLAHEWRTIPVEIDGPLKARISALSVEEAWAEISSLKDFSNEPIFPQLSQLAAIVLSLPHSNAESERIFSIVTDVKNKKRNKMGVGNLSAIAVVRECFCM